MCSYIENMWRISFIVFMDKVVWKSLVQSIQLISRIWESFANMFHFGDQSDLRKLNGVIQNMSSPNLGNIRSMSWLNNSCMF